MPAYREGRRDLSTEILGTGSQHVCANQTKLPTIQAQEAPHPSKEMGQDLSPAPAPSQATSPPTIPDGPAHTSHTQQIRSDTPAIFSVLFSHVKKVQLHQERLLTHKGN